MKNCIMGRKINMKKLSLVFASSTILFAVILSACKPAAMDTDSATPQAATSVQPTATTELPHELNICLGVEPSSLYFYESSSQAMWNVLEAIYDGPVDMQRYTQVPVILERIPSTADDNLIYQSVPVQAGDIVINIHGDPVKLDAGVEVYPSGCTTLDCAIVYDGYSEMNMDRLVATFTLLSGVTWSDGEILTAQDSVFSYLVAASMDTPAWKRPIDQTEAYEALDDRTVRWISLPGLVTAEIADYFWLPLPEHILRGMSAKELLEADETNRYPVGWGAYMIQEWIAGERITLVKNPYYFRADEGLPKFETLHYLFVGEQADSALISFDMGQCDIIDQTVAWETGYGLMRDREIDGSAIVYHGLGPQWEHLDFNIFPASYDDGYSAAEGDRPDFFGDVNVRRAFAYCINRYQIQVEHYGNLTQVPTSYLPPEHPMYEPGLPEYAYDPEEGARLLQAAGWADDDGDPATPRIAAGIPGIADGTPFSVTLSTSPAEIRQQVARDVAEYLGQCGIAVDVNVMPRSQFYAPAPDGVVFGRQYDLAQFAWASGNVAACYIYMSSEIANAGNSWLGERYGGLNTMGYTNTALDEACSRAMSGDRYSQQALEQQREVQRILASELPSIPLFYFPRLALSRVDLCGMSMDVTARSELFHIEEFEIGNACE